MELTYLIDLIGTFAFAVSGVLAAGEHKMDLFGASILGTVTAIGGGTIRDLLIGYSPVSWMQDNNYLYIILAAIIFSFMFKPVILRLRKTLFLFDTVGIASFAAIGIRKTIEAGLDPLIAVTMGTVSAVFGGVLRDVLANEVPLVFRKDFYATVCILGGVIYFLVLKLTGQEAWATLAAGFTILVLRILAVKNNWRLPQVN